jgi:LysR family carnitine catabolism transcriptional activator
MNIKQIDLRLLRSFLTVARTGNFVRASEALSITQSALSQQMKELAGYLDLPLFEKRGRSLILTKFGNGLLLKIEPLLGQIEEALMQSLDDSRNIVGTLRVGATNTYSKTIALPTCMELLKEYPSLKIELQELSAQKVLAELMEGTIDVAIIPQDYQFPDLEWKELISEQFSVIGNSKAIDKLPNAISLKHLAKYELATLNRQFLMRQKIDAQARKENVSLNIRMQVSSMGDLLGIAKSGQLLALGSSIALLNDRQLKSKEIKGELLIRTAAVCWRKTKFVNSAMMAFQEKAEEISRSLESEIKKRRCEV